MARLKPRPAQPRIGGRIPIVAAVAALGLGSVTHTVSVVAQRSNPDQAYALGPANGAAAAFAAEREFSIAPANESTSRAAMLARKALRIDPTAVKAVTVLALQAQLRGETEYARELFSYALLLSRRELQPHVWAIEEGVSRGDIIHVLRTYDLALRTSKGARDLLFPQLANGLTEPLVRSRVVSLIEAAPEWKDDFLRYVATAGNDPNSGALFFKQLRSAGVSLPEDVNTALVNLFITQGRFREAYDYYATFRDAAPLTISRDPDFRLDDITRTEFDWHFSANPGLSAAILRDGQRGQLDFFAPPSVGGPLLRQTQLLPPGDYRLSGVSRDIDQPEGSRPYWILECKDGRQLGTVEVPNSSVANGRFGGAVSIPADCPVQVIIFMARPSSQSSGLTGQLLRAKIEPVDAESGD